MLIVDLIEEKCFFLDFKYDVFLLQWEEELRSVLGISFY